MNQRDEWVAAYRAHRRKRARQHALINLMMFTAIAVTVPLAYLLTI